MSHFAILGQPFKLQDKILFLRNADDKMNVVPSAKVARAKYGNTSSPSPFNSQMKSFIGTTNTTPVRPSGETEGVEQHRICVKMRVGHLERNLYCAKLPVNRLAVGCNCPFPVC